MFNVWCYVELLQGGSTDLNLKYFNELYFNELYFLQSMNRWYFSRGGHQSFHKSTSPHVQSAATMTFCFEFVTIIEDIM